jgi:hypothetical protein
MQSKRNRSHKKKQRLTRRKMRQSGGEKELIELITKDGSSLINDEATAILRLNTLPANIRLDLHGVLDIIPDNKVIKKNATDIICVISFVGRKGGRRDMARREIKERIAKKQIDYGVLIFNRGSGDKIDTFTDPGSKAWVNKHILCAEKCIFIDDSIDHIKSTISLIGKKLVKSIHIESTDPNIIIGKIHEIIS